MLTARRPQRTIAREKELQGVGFIFGSDVTMRFRPAEADHGVVFVRTDLPERPAVRAHIRHRHTDYDDQLDELVLLDADYLYGDVRADAHEAVDRFLENYRNRSE